MIDHQEATEAGVQSVTKTILLVEDDADIGAFFVQVISHKTPYLTQLVTTSAKALEFVQGIKPNLFLLDCHLHSRNGIELFDLLHAIQGLEDIPAIILSASLDQYAHEIEQRHLIGFEKPIELDDLIAAIKKVIA